MLETEALINEMITLANQAGNNPIGHAIMRPLQRFGRIWFDQGQWWCSIRMAQIVTYTEQGGITTTFGANEWIATDAWWPLDTL